MFFSLPGSIYLYFYLLFEFVQVVNLTRFIVALYCGHFFALLTSSTEKQKSKVIVNSCSDFCRLVPALQITLQSPMTQLTHLKDQLTHLKDHLLLPCLDHLLVSAQKVNHYLDSVHLLQNYLAAVVQSDMFHCFQF